MTRAIICSLILALGLLLTLPADSWAESDENLDYKADFIVKLPKYVTWPDGQGSNAAGDIVVHIVGESPLTEKIAAAGAAADPKVVVKSVSPDSDFVTGAQIVFTPTQDTKELAKFMKQVNGKSVLTVSEAHYFSKYGVMVNFVIKEEDGKEKVKFEVNRHTMGDANIKMSSQLLKLAVTD